ncbi:MAG: DegT/DnrJ/EryC1/StrS family aminotransferase [Nonlabens sp.]
MSIKVPLMNLKAQYLSLKEDLDYAVNNTIENAAFIGGPAVTNFENEFAEYLGGGEVISCGNGTDSLEMILSALDIGKGDEVIVPAMTWISTGEVVVTRGAKLVFADVEASTGCLNLQDVQQKITENTKIIIAVHLYGHVTDMPRLMEIAGAHKIKVIEDCAQAHGSSISDCKMGTWGVAGSFSFFPSKNLGCFGDGGAVFTKDKDLATKIRLIARHGQETKHVHLINGRNSRLDSLQARVLSVKLPHLEKWIDQKNKHARFYLNELAGIPELKLPVPTKYEARISWHLFVVRTSKRDELMKFLESNGVETNIHYPTALPFQPCYADWKHESDDFPGAFEIQKETLSIPIFAELKQEELDYVVDRIKSFFRQ